MKCVKIGLCDPVRPLRSSDARCCLLQEHELNLHGGHSQSQLHTPGTHYCLTLDLVTLYTPLKHSKHTCSDSLNLKPPAPPYPLQDFKALCKCCSIMIALCSRADHYIFALWFLSFFFLLSFFPRLTSAVGHWMSTILPHMVWP